MIILEFGVIGASNLRRTKLEHSNNNFTTMILCIVNAFDFVGTQYKFH